MNAFDLYIIGQQLINGLVLGATYGLIAIGYSMVYGIIGMINFAHGEIYMVSAYVTALVIALIAYFGGLPVGAAIMIALLFTMLITAILGWLIERVAYRPLKNSFRLAPLISAIGVSLILQNFIQLAQGARNQAMPTLLEGVLRIGGEEQFMQISYHQLLILVAALVSMLSLNTLIGKTKFGRSCRATQQDPVMAEILGINTQKVISLVFVIGAVFAAIAGTFVTMNYGSFDFYIGFVTGIKAFTAAVLGGIGSLPGAMLGGLLVGIAESFFSGFVNTDYKDVFAFGILVLILIIKPSGLLGHPEVEKV